MPGAKSALRNKGHSPTRELYPLSALSQKQATYCDVRLIDINTQSTYTTQPSCPYNISNDASQQTAERCGTTMMARLIENA